MTTRVRPCHRCSHARGGTGCKKDRDDSELRGAVDRNWTGKERSLREKITSNGTCNLAASVRCLETISNKTHDSHGHLLLQ